MTFKTGELIETLLALGADVHETSGNSFTTQDLVAVVIAAECSPIFSIKGRP